MWDELNLTVFIVKYQYFILSVKKNFINDKILICLITLFSNFL